MTLKSRSCRKSGNAMANYLAAMQDTNADEFDCLLFRAEESAGEIVVPDEHVLGTIDRNEQAVTYADPVPARARKVRDAMPLAATDGAAGRDGDMNASVVLVLNVAAVPSQSVVQYSERAPGGAVRQVNVYVVMSAPMGAVSGAEMRKHYCIEFRVPDERRKKHERNV